VQILGKVLMVGISLLTTGLLTRGLGLKVYGEFILITSLLIFFDTLSDFGSKIIGVREASKETEEKNIKKVWINMSVLRISVSLISFGLSLIFIYTWPDLAEVRQAAVVAFLMILLTSVAGSLEIVWQTRQRMSEKVIWRYCFRLCFCLDFINLGLVWDWLGFFVVLDC
jgi:O-antigen/teichoic acid export membrane protein